MITEIIVKNLEEGLRIMGEAVESRDQRRWDVGQGAYDGGVLSAQLEHFDVSKYVNRGTDLIKTARSAGMIIRRRQ
jgi:hypothetical protein